MSSPLFAIPEAKNSENCQYFEPVTPISSSDEELSNSPTAFEEQTQQEFPFCQSNNNYVTYEDNVQDDSKIQELSPYASSIQYTKTSKPMLPSYSDSTSPRGDPTQLAYQSTPSPVQEARIYSSYSEDKTSPTITKGIHNLGSIYGSEVYRPYENSEVNGFVERRTTPNSSPVHEPRIYSAYNNEKASSNSRNIHSLATIYGSEIYKPYENSLASIEPSGFADRRPTTNQEPNIDLQSSTSTSVPLQRQEGSNVSHKRARTQFTSIQLVEMEREFTDGRYLSRAKRIDLAQRLSLTEKQIKVWFQNRRMKFNRDTKIGNKNTKYGRNTISPQSSQSDATSPNTDRSDTNRLLRHSPLLKYEYNAPLGYQGFSSNQWNDSMYCPNPYSSVYNPGVSSSDSYLNNHSLYNNNYASASYVSNFTPSYESNFSSGLPGHLNVAQPVASKPTFEISLHQLKKENQEYPPNVTVSWGASATQSELLEL